MSWTRGSSPSSASRGRWARSAGGSSTATTWAPRAAGRRSRSGSPRPARRWASTRPIASSPCLTGPSPSAPIRERAFPTAIELLDWYHLTEQLRSGVGRQHEEVLSTSIGAARPGDVAALLAILRSHARALERDDPEQALRCEGLIGYVEGNRRGIANYRIVPLASSGPMEKGVDITIARRFKSRGMSWFRRGVSHLLHLKLLRLNGRWDRHWAERLAAERRPWPTAA